MAAQVAAIGSGCEMGDDGGDATEEGRKDEDEPPPLPPPVGAPAAAPSAVAVITIRASLHPRSESTLAMIARAHFSPVGIKG
jgi:hypothetical protein